MTAVTCHAFENNRFYGSQTVLLGHCILATIAYVYKDPSSSEESEE